MEPRAVWGLSTGVTASAPEMVLAITGCPGKLTNGHNFHLCESSSGTSPMWGVVGIGEVDEWDVCMRCAMRGRGGRD